MGFIDRIKAKFSKDDTELVETNYIEEAYAPDEIIPLDDGPSYETVRDVVNITDAVGNLLFKTDGALQQRLAEIDANLQMNLASMEAEMKTEMQKEDNIHTRKMTDRALVSEVIEKTSAFMSPELASRILDSIDNLSNNDR